MDYADCGEVGQAAHRSHFQIASLPLMAGQVTPHLVSIFRYYQSKAGFVSQGISGIYGLFHH